MKRSWIKRKTGLRAHGKSPVAKCKQRIQDLLRAIVIIRDGGCVLRHFKEAGECGGYGPVSGKLILQAEHLNTRERNISYGDLRNIVCLCQRHHGFWKPQNSRLYWKLIEQVIGAERQAYLDKVQNDHKNYPMNIYDWGLVEISLKQELANLTKQR